MTIALNFTPEWTITTLVALLGVAITAWRWIPEIVERGREKSRGIVLDSESHATVFADTDDALLHNLFISRSGETPIVSEGENVRLRIILRCYFQNTSKSAKTFKLLEKCKVVTPHGDFEAGWLNSSGTGAIFFTIAPGEHKQMITVCVTPSRVDRQIDFDAIANDATEVDIYFGQGEEVNAHILELRTGSDLS